MSQKYKKFSHVRYLVVMVGTGTPVTPNGPAIKVVSVAERVKAGTESPHRGRVHLPAGKSEAWRGFCRQVASF